MSDFRDMFEQIGYNLEDGDIYSWLESDYNEPGVQVFSDTEICDLVSHDTSESEELTEEEEDKCQQERINRYLEQVIQLVMLCMF